MRNLYVYLSLLFFSAIIFSNCSQPTSVNTEKTSTGDTAWSEVGTSGKPSFLNGWTNTGAYSTCAYRKDGFGYVHLKGIVTNGTLSYTIYYLPVGYRPATILMIGNTSSYVAIGTNGAVFGNTATIYLDGISFYAEQ